MNELLLLPLTELAAHLRAKKSSPVELMQAVLDRIAETNGDLNAFVALHPRDADSVYCVSRTGQVFGTQDGGRSWTEDRLPEGVSDVYALACG